MRDSTASRISTNLGHCQTLTVSNAVVRSSNTKTETRDESLLHREDPVKGMWQCSQPAESGTKRMVNASVQSITVVQTWLIKAVKKQEKGLTKQVQEKYQSGGLQKHFKCTG